MSPVTTSLRKMKSLLGRVLKKLAALKNDAQTKEIRTLRKQRDQAREQRDTARQQRERLQAQKEDARRQRDRSKVQRDEALSVLRDTQKRLGKSGRAHRRNYLKHLSDARNRYHQTQPREDPTAPVSLEQIEIENGVLDPVFSHIYPERITPPKTVAFVTVANDLFVPGLEVLIASLLNVYPDLDSDIHVLHDGTITDFSQERLKGLYRKTKFSVPDVSWITEIPQDSKNRKRIGILGYLSVTALQYQQYDRVIILDSDTAILDDISAFWTGLDQPLGTKSPATGIETQHIIACHDHGARPWCAISQRTGRPIINSGIISIPRRYLTEKDFADIQSLVLQNHETYCPLLDRFADQKAWNRFILKRDVDILPINFNCNIKYLDQYRSGDLSFIRMIHFTGYKPWFNAHYINNGMIPESDSVAVLPVVWQEICSKTLGRRRQQQYTQATMRPDYFQMAPEAGRYEGKPMAMFIGNGPSLKDMDLTRADRFETFVFNWFVLHEGFDDVRPNHLCLGSHMFFGGWHTQDPVIPEDYLAALTEKAWKPIIWTSFYFREYIESSGVLRDFDVRYVLFEKPQKDFIDSSGLHNLDARGFVQDGRTGVLSLALPIAYRLGYRDIGLVGCDSNYNQTAASATEGNYFYDKAKHTTQETRQDSLTQTWGADGPGFFAYQRQHVALALEGGGFVDFTRDGALPLPKGTWSDL